MGLVAAVMSGYALAVLAPAIRRLVRGGTGWLLALLPLGLAVYFGGHVEQAAAGVAWRESFSWAPALGVELTFYVDGLSVLFGLLISGMGAIVLVYAGGYLKGQSELGRLYVLLLIFMASMLGLVCADNLLLLYVFWELTSLSSYLLIGFEHEREKARSAALQALLVTSGGGLAMLVGFLLLGSAGGSLELSTLLAGELQSHPLYTPALVLVLLGAFTKSAQFPFHFWLPRAMEAPTPVSAYLHSATMVKAGVYLLARLNPLLGGTDLWIWTVTSVGVASMLVGAWLALQQSRLKAILAYTTVSALGMMVMLLGLGGAQAVHAAMAFLLAHALYKGALFLVAGAVTHETGESDVDRLGGLMRAMPVTALASVLATLSMSALPPLFGFIAKEMLYEAALHQPAAVLLSAVTVLANVVYAAAAWRVGFRPFLGRFRSTPEHPHEAPVSMWLGPVVLAGAGLAFAFWPGIGVERLLSAASGAVLGEAVTTHLALWHGLTPALGLSVLTVAGAGAVYAGRGVLTPRLAVERWGPAAWYELAFRGLEGLAQGQTRLLQSGSLRHYLRIILAATFGLTGWTLLSRVEVPMPENWRDVRFYEVGLAVLVVAAIAATLRARGHLAAIVCLGVVGYGVALVFVLFGAPDLAMTQFLIETLTVILFVLVFYHLPEAKVRDSGMSRCRDAMLATAGGGLMSVLVLMATAARAARGRSISEYFIEHSLPQAHGRNIVNVILVDFRGFDTLGEITVLAMGGVGVYALLKLGPNRKTREQDGVVGAEGVVSTDSIAKGSEP